jgi:hypothetical protein
MEAGRAIAREEEKKQNISTGLEPVPHRHSLSLPSCLDRAFAHRIRGFLTC